MTVKRIKILREYISFRIKMEAYLQKKIDEEKAEKLTSSSSKR